MRLYAQLSPGNATVHAVSEAAALEAILAAPHVGLLVADQGDVVGTVTLVIVPNLTHGAKPWAQVENMVTDASVRGSGVGRRLIEECLRLAREARCYKVQLQSGNQRRGPENDAHGFYEHLGFAASSVGFRYYLE